MSRHPWNDSIRDHREVSRALANASAAAVIDVGRQRESIHQPSPAHLRDNPSLCVACQNDPHDDRSDFCTPCRQQRATGRNHQ